MAKNEIQSTENNSSLLNIADANISSIIEENMGPGGLNIGDLERIKMPAGGGLAWEVPTLAGVEPQRTITGVLVAQKKVRAYYAQQYTGESVPPDCASPDSIIGFGDPGGVCKQCQMSQWGTKVSQDGEHTAGQACAQRWMLLILPENSILPYVISIPPSSIGVVGKFLARLIGVVKPFYGVMTELSLAKDKSKGGIEYSKLVMNIKRELTPEEFSAVKAYKEAIVPAFNEVTVDQSELESE